MTTLLLLFITAVLVLFAGLGKDKNMLQSLTFFGVALAFGFTCMDLYDHRGWLNTKFISMIHFDDFALAFSGVVCASLLLLVGLSGWGFRQLKNSLGDQYALLLFSVCGALCMFSFQNIVMLFLGIEILSIPLYVLAGSRRDDLKSNEAALKYFLMGAFATGIFLFGAALIYGSTGSFDLETINLVLSEKLASPGMTNVGILLIMIGLCFKVSAVPFHFWAPDVYTGSPTMVTAFMSTIVKTAAVAAFFKLFSTAFAPAIDFWSAPLAVVVGLTMILANTTAIFQTNFKRMMAYSSISHAGYLLLGVLSANVAGAGGAILLYTLTYSIATICAFAIFMVVSEKNGSEDFSVFNGLSKTNPMFAAVMAVSMLSLAGIPPLAGFFGKYFLFAAAFGKYPWLVVLAVVNSAVSIYYYFKVIVAMYFSHDGQPETLEIPRGVQWMLAGTLVLLVALTFLPGNILGLI